MCIVRCTWDIYCSNTLSNGSSSYLCPLENNTKMVDPIRVEKRKHISVTLIIALTGVKWVVLVNSDFIMTYERPQWQKNRHFAEKKANLSLLHEWLHNLNPKIGYMWPTKIMALKLKALCLLFIALNYTTRQKKIFPSDSKLVYCLLNYCNLSRHCANNEKSEQNSQNSWNESIYMLTNTKVDYMKFITIKDFFWNTFSHFKEQPPNTDMLFAPD